jgi:AraC-like DNA-binding protein
MPPNSIIRRASPAPSPRLPLGARSVAHVRFDPFVVEDEQQRPFLKVMWSISGKADVLCGARRLTLNANQLAIFPAGSVHYAKAQEIPWEVRWWTVDGSQLQPIAAAFGFGQSGIYDVGAAPAALFRRLEKEIQDVSPAGELRASAVAYELLCAAAVRVRRPAEDAMIRDALAGIQKNWSHPEFSIKRLAGALGVNRSSLARRFHVSVGLPPRDYLRNLRVQQAMMLLKRTDLSIQEVARRCGFEDSSYFSRYFRQLEGLSPRSFRRSYNA